MFKKNYIEEIIQEVRKELDLSLKIKPKVSSIFYDKEKNFLLVVAEDRPDKAAIIGPGGMVIKNVMKKLNLSGISVRTKIDLEVKRFRVKVAIKRLKEICKLTSNDKIKCIINSRLIPLLENELNYPKRRIPTFTPVKDCISIVSFSGGVDSWVAAVLSKIIGLNPITVTVNPATWIIPEKEKKLIETLTLDYDIPHIFTYSSSEKFRLIFDKGLKGDIHPCGRCHKLIEEEVVNFAVKNNASIIIFGDLLPTGNYSAYLVNKNLLRFNILAALGFSKLDVTTIAKEFSYPNKFFVYGCPMLREIFKRHLHLTYPSILRVLRECRAGILEPSEANTYIKNILLQFIKQKLGNKKTL